MPCQDRSNRDPTSHHSLGPILENEGTLDGTYKVIDDIFLQQLQLDPNADFTDGPLYLTYGDQKTISLVQAIKGERRESKPYYQTYSSILPMPGLFHRRMNFITEADPLAGVLLSSPTSTRTWRPITLSKASITS